jgi:hypothetical protein
MKNQNQRQQCRRWRGRRGIAEHQDDGRGSVDEKAVHGDEMGDAAPRVAELARDHSLAGRLQRQPQLFAGADVTLGVRRRLAPAVEEIARASLVEHVEQGAANHQQHHQPDIGLYGGGRHAGRERREGIGGEHRVIPVSAAFLIGLASSQVPNRNTRPLRYQPSGHLSAPRRHRQFTAYFLTPPGNRTAEAFPADRLAQGQKVNPDGAQARMLSQSLSISGNREALPRPLW